jgi:hypothetical protein
MTKVDAPQGTLDMPVLKTLRYDPTRSFAIDLRIRPADRRHRQGAANRLDEK